MYCLWLLEREYCSPEALSLADPVVQGEKSEPICPCPPSSARGLRVSFYLYALQVLRGRGGGGLCQGRAARAGLGLQSSSLDAYLVFSVIQWRGSVGSFWFCFVLGGFLGLSNLFFSSFFCKIGNPFEERRWRMYQWRQRNRCKDSRAIQTSMFRK